jgi:hypothetical protein
MTDIPKRRYRLKHRGTTPSTDTNGARVFPKKADVSGLAASLSTFFGVTFNPPTPSGRLARPAQ